MNWLKKLLHFALRSCYILSQKLLHLGFMLHFASIVTFCGVTVSIRVPYYHLFSRYLIFANYREKCATPFNFSVEVLQISCRETLISRVFLNHEN